MSTIKFRMFICVVFLLTFLTPAITLAQSAISGNTAGFDNLDKLIKSFANGVVLSTGYMMFTLAVVAFFFGIVQFIWSARQGAEGKGIQKGTQFMKWGLIAIFVMFSLWGIVKFAQGVFGIQGDNTIIVPSLRFQQSGAGGDTGVTGLNTNTNVTGGLAAGVACVNTSQCASGLTCVGGNASNRVCTRTASGTGASGANGNTNVTGGGITTQAQANALAQQCITFGNSQTACQNAANAALANYLSGSGASSASIQTCMDNGGDLIICECEARGGAWSLTDNECSVSGSGNNGNNGGGTSASIQTCMDNGGSRPSCECEARDGVWSLTDNECSVSGSGNNGNNGGGTSASIQTCMDNGGSRPSCECEARDASWDMNDNSCSDSNVSSSASGGCSYAFSDCTTSSGQAGQCDDNLNCGISNTNYDNNAVWGEPEQIGDSNFYTDETGDLQYDGCSEGSLCG